MKNSNQAQLIADDAMAGDFARCKKATNVYLTLALGEIGKDAPIGDDDTLHALDGILCELQSRPNIDRVSRRWFERIHTGVLGQL